LSIRIANKNAEKVHLKGGSETHRSIRGPSVGV